MLDFFLAIPIWVYVLWGGVFYLLNKGFFLAADITPNKDAIRKRRVWSWIVYIIGLPAWLVILSSKQNYMAAAAEAAGLPAMILGLVNAYHGIERKNKWPKYVALAISLIGIIYSWHIFGGFNLFTQYLEIGIVVGFLAGTFFLAEGWYLTGYVCYMFMCVSCAWLMEVEEFPELYWQQIASVIIVFIAFCIRLRRKLAHK